MIKVGVLSRRSGVSIRTLHYYEEIGLLQPWGRTHSGHRLYAEEQVLHLQQILSLRELGLSLHEIAGLIRGGNLSLRQIIRLHLEHLRQRIAMERKLYRRLQAVAAQMDSNGTDSVPVEEIFKIMEVMKMFEKYYTPEQLEHLKQRRERLGEERLRQAEKEWQILLAAFGQEQSKGSDPSHPRVRRLAQKAKELIQEFTGGDPAIEASLRRMYQQEGAGKVLQPHGIQMPEGLGRFMAQARQALDESSEA